MVSLHEGVIVGLLELGQGVVDMAMTRLIRANVQQQIAHRCILQRKQALLQYIFILVFLKV